MAWIDAIKLSTNAFLAGFNWQIMLLKVALVVAVCAGMFSWGVWHERTNVAEEAAQRAKANAVVIYDVVVARIPVVQKQDEKAAQVGSKVKDAKEKLHAEINLNPDVDVCNLSDNELRIYRELAEQTRLR